jgi:hypothetical protein
MSLRDQLGSLVGSRTGLHEAAHWLAKALRQRVPQSRCRVLPSSNGWKIEPHRLSAKVPPETPILIPSRLCLWGCHAADIGSFDSCCKRFSLEAAVTRWLCLF